VNAGIINEIQTELDNHSEFKQKFNDIKNEIINSSMYFPDSTIDLINKKDVSIKKVETSFRANLSSILVQIRSGDVKIHKLKDLLKHFQQSHICARGINEFLNKNKKLFNKMEKIEHYKSLNIVYLDNTINVDMLIQKHQSKDIYIMLFSEELIDHNKDLYQKNLDFFYSLVRNNHGSLENTIFWIFDYEIQPASSICCEKKICIKHFKNGRVIDEDLCQNNEIEIWNDRCIAETKEMEYNLKKPLKTTKILLACPNWKQNAGCQKLELEWWCKKCQTLIEYDLISKFFCECGGSSASEYGFRCKDKHHPENKFIKYEKTELEDLLRLFKPNKEVNILFLGESGVGKRYS
jgi:hypothetical protein